MKTARPTPSLWKPAQCRADLCGGPKVDRRAVLGEALEQRSPVARASLVELRRRCGAVVRQPFDVEHAGRVCEPVAPERPRITEHVEVDREPHRAEPAVQHDAERHSDGVDQDVDRRADATLDEVLVQLVGDRVRDPERERRPLDADRPQQQRAEQRELRGVRQLPEDEIPGPEAGAEIGDGREGEDDGRPENDRRPQAQRDWKGHTTMVGSAPHKERSEGTRCKSGTVPPL